MVRFVENSLLLNQLNISRADIPCILENDVGEAARSTQPVTLYITVNITPPNLYDSPQRIPKGDDWADKTMKQMVPIDLRITWERAVGRIKWVMDTLDPIAEVRSFLMSLATSELIPTQLSPFAKMAHGLLLAIPKACLFLSFSEPDAHSIFVWMVDAPGTVSR